MSVYTQTNNDLLLNAVYDCNNIQLLEDPKIRKAILNNCMLPLRKRIEELETKLEGCNCAKD